jgi:hypothetical protein
MIVKAASAASMDPKLMCKEKSPFEGSAIGLALGGGCSFRIKNSIIKKKTIKNSN